MQSEQYQENDSREMMQHKKIRKLFDFSLKYGNKRGLNEVVRSE